MKTTVKLAEFNVRVDHWNKDTMMAYLRTCAKSRYVIESVWCFGKDSYPVDTDNGEIADYEYGELVNRWIASSNDDYPKILDSNVPFYAYLDCGMHLLFLGIVAYVHRRANGRLHKTP